MEDPNPIPIPTPTPCWSNILQKPPAPKPKEDPVTRIFESCKSNKGIAVAVVDANAIIQGGDSLRNSADKLVSVREVIEEVRDPASRRNLMLMLSTVETMVPSPEALKTVIKFARETGDLQTLSDVDLKLIALTYTLEAQIHGTKHLRDSPPPVHTVNVKRLAEKDMPGWGSNVPNLEEWEALENAADAGVNSDSRILPLKDLNLNVMSVDGQSESGDCSIENGGQALADDQDAESNLRKPRRYMPVKKKINLERKMVADGIDASQGQIDDNASDWLPAVSRSTQRRFLRRKARCELSDMSSEKDDQLVQTDMELEVTEESRQDVPFCEGSEVTPPVNVVSNNVQEEKTDEGDLSSILQHMRLEENLSSPKQEESKGVIDSEGLGVYSAEAVEDNFDSANVVAEGDCTEICDGVDLPKISSQTSVDSSFVDDTISEQSWTVRSLSESSVACVTSDFAMQNVILQIGLRLLAPGGMQIRQLHRWILKCHACNKVTAEIGRIFCPKCGNGGTLRKVAVTVGENGVVLAARRPRIILRGTKFSLPLPQGGRDAVTKNLILREDQLPHKVLYPKTKKKLNKEGDDLFNSDFVFGHTADKKAPLKPPIRQALAVFSGKRNPNDNHYSRSKH